MIFLNNVYITNEGNPFSSAYDRGNLPTQDRLEIYKYSLASLSKAYPWKRAIIYYKLHEEYHDKEQEFVEFVKNEFKHTDLILRNTRNEYVSDWMHTHRLINDELIWFYCNHDHVYLDNTDYLLNYVKMFRENFSNTLSSIYFSHWPEMLCYVADSADDNPGCLPRPLENYKVEEIDDIGILKFPSKTMVCSIQIITKKLYEHWWVDGWEGQDVSKIFLPRSDHARSIPNFKELESFDVFVPTKEICRHFDGYGHTNPPINNEDCPPLTIPQGFFENNIKINFDQIVDINREKGYTYLDSLNDHYYASLATGTDYKWTKDDIPHFWLDRIESYTGTEPSWDAAVNAQMQNLIDLIFANARLHPRKFINARAFAKCPTESSDEPLISWPEWIKEKYLDTIMKAHGYHRKLDE